MSPQPRFWPLVARAVIGILVAAGIVVPLALVAARSEGGTSVLALLIATALIAAPLIALNVAIGPVTVRGRMLGSLFAGLAAFAVSFVGSMAVWIWILLALSIESSEQGFAWWLLAALLGLALLAGLAMAMAAGFRWGLIRDQRMAPGTSGVSMISRYPYP